MIDCPYPARSRIERGIGVQALSGIIVAVEDAVAHGRALGGTIKRKIDIPIFIMILAFLVLPPHGAEGGVVSGMSVAIQSRNFEVAEATIPEMQEAMERGLVTSVGLVDAYLARIEAYDRRGPMLNTVIRLNPNARAIAAALDIERVESGTRGPLHGIPILLKDNYDTADMPTTGSSIALAGLIPPNDAFQVSKLRDAGAIVLGKLNMHELAAGITTISSLGGQTRNPYDPSRYPGGSSGGTGAAIAASFAAIGWGSDTCGSIRIPAAHNNLFGLRPTKGLSSIDGIIPLSHTQDVGGPLARTVIDLAIGLDATIGADVKDQATRILEGRSLPRFVDGLHGDALQNARLGVLTALFGDGQEDQEIVRAVRDAIDQMKELGAEVVDVEIPGLDSILSGSSVIAHEFKWDLIDYLAATPGAPVHSLRDILDRGLYHVELEGTFRRRSQSESRDNEEYREALSKQAAVRHVVIATLDELGLDALVYPTMRRRVAQIGDPQRGSNCQLSASAGLPALSVPAGFISGGLPVSLELLGSPLDDSRLLTLGFAFEQAMKPRRAPTRTPALESGRAPDPLAFIVSATEGGVTVRVRFILDITTNALSYDLTILGVATEDIHGVGLHRSEKGNVGAVIYRMSGPGIRSRSGTMMLDANEQDALMDGSLYLKVYTSEWPAGVARVQITVPAA